MKSICILFFSCISLSAVHCQGYDQRREELEAYINEAKQNVDVKFRQLYHASPPVGWMNDPNGFSYFNGKYHLFYQFYPYDSVWGPMHWGHYTSENLVDWEYQPTALLPEDEYCFSGSAVTNGSNHVLIYTGRLNGEDELNYWESQYLAISTDGINYEKYQGNPVLITTFDGAQDFRDPKVWRHEEWWYMVIGSKNPERLGRVLIYRSENLINWEYLDVIGESTGPMGYMWECPDFFELEGRFILLMSPQGLIPEGDKFFNIYQVGYYYGLYNYDRNNFTIFSEFRELDHGHDFYAATTTEVDGRRLLIAWMSTWEVPRPEAEDGWAGGMTIVRELHLNSRGTLLQLPVREMVELRVFTYPQALWENNFMLTGFGSAIEIEIVTDATADIVLLLEGTLGGESAVLKYDSTNRKVIFDRGSDDRRTADWNPMLQAKWRIFFDTISAELFCGDGEVVFSSLVFKLGDWRITNLGPSYLASVHILRGSMTF